jgi:hypothetical protein
MILPLIPEGAPIVLSTDETLERRKGKKIRAKGYYRDAVRSSKSQVVKTSGLKWLVFALSVKLPFIERVLAMPFLTILEPSKKSDEACKKRHKTTLDWTCQALGQICRWLGKKRQIVLVGDGGFAAGALALRCIGLGVSLVTRLKMNAALFDFPPEKVPGKRGRVPSKGVKLKNFKQMLGMKELPWQEMEVIGYGGIKRLVRFVSATCMWGADGSIPIPIRWMLVTDPLGKMDPLPLMSTDPNMSPEQMLRLYIDRWSIEVTFEEVREHLGVETQRQWSDKAIARSTPILMGLYSLICLMALRLKESGEFSFESTAWYQKEEAKFSDVLRAVRLTIWKDNLIFGKAKNMPSRENITPELADWMEFIVKRVLQAA